MRIFNTVTHMQKHTAILMILLLLSHFGSVDPSATGNCLPGEVSHFNLLLHKEFCCIPVSLPKGYGYKICTRNGMPDTIEVCPKEPVQLYQWDDTTTASEATCTAEMQCLHEENMKIKKCEKNGLNCHSECVCNFPGGYCGIEYFDCNPFPVDCPKEDVREDCSCRRSIPSSGSESKNRTGKSDFYVPNPMNPDTSFSKLPSSSSAGKSDGKREGDQTPDVGVMKEKENNSNLNNNATISEMEREENLSSGLGIPIAATVSASAFGGIGTVFVCILVFVFWKNLNKKLRMEKCNNRSANQDAERQKPVLTVKQRQKPVLTVKPFLQNLQQDQDEEAQFLQRHELQLNLPVNCPPLGSSLFHSHDNTTDQLEVFDEPGGHQTGVKVVVSSENEEDGHQNSRLDHVGAVPTQSSDGVWSDFYSNILHSSNIPQAESVSLREGGEEEEL